MNGSIFPAFSLDRSKVRWADFLHTPTPVEHRNGIWMKREDAFAPLGYGGINGGKVRLIVWLTERYLGSASLLRQDTGLGLLIAGSVRSPQIARVAAVAKHYGIGCTIVIGSKLATAIKHENVAIAAKLGANFVSSPVAYNPALQKMALRLKGMPAHANYRLMEYALTIEGELVEPVYRFMGEQVQNLPSSMETLIAPAGSYNTCAALLYALARERAHLPKLKRVILFGIGPSRLAWLDERLAAVEAASGITVRKLFRRRYEHNPELAAKLNLEVGDGPILLEHFDLHESRFCAYDDEMPAMLHGVAMHPTYEGKIVTYMRTRPDLKPLLTQPGVCFWIVGSEPRWSAMEPHVVPYLRAGWA